MPDFCEGEADRLCQQKLREHVMLCVTHTFVGKSGGGCWSSAVAKQLLHSSIAGDDDTK